MPPFMKVVCCFVFSWDHCKSQEKMETMFIQNFGGQTKSIYNGIFESGLYNTKLSIRLIYVLKPL